MDTYLSGDGLLQETSKPEAASEHRYADPALDEYLGEWYEVKVTAAGCAEHQCESEECDHTAESPPILPSFFSAYHVAPALRYLTVMH